MAKTSPEVSETIRRVLHGERRIDWLDFVGMWAVCRTVSGVAEALYRSVPRCTRPDVEMVLAMANYLRWQGVELPEEPMGLGRCVYEGRVYVADGV